MEKVFLLLEKQGYDRETLERYKDELGTNAHPALLYFALDSCSLHAPPAVRLWLRMSQLRSPTSDRQGIAARIKYLAGLRRRSLKCRLGWVENRFAWTNQINRAEHYAEKLL